MDRTSDVISIAEADEEVRAAFQLIEKVREYAVVTEMYFGATNVSADVRAVVNYAGEFLDKTTEHYCQKCPEPTPKEKVFAAKLVSDLCESIFCDDLERIEKLVGAIRSLCDVSEYRYNPQIEFYRRRLVLNAVLLLDDCVVFRGRVPRVLRPELRTVMLAPAQFGYLYGHQDRMERYRLICEKYS